MYTDKGPDFAREVEDLLALGGSVSPTELCARVGFDVTNKAHWQLGFDQIAAKIERLEAIISES